MGVPLLVAGIAGGAISAAGQLASGEATAQSDAYKAQVAANNAKIATTEAKQDIQSGEISAVNQGLKARAAVGSEKANQGAAGIDTNTGSAVALRSGTAELGMLDALTVRSNAAKKAYGDEVEATSDTAQSQLDTMAGSAAETAGEIGAAGSLLSSVSTVGGNYASWQAKYGSSGGGSSGGGDAGIGGSSYADELAAGTRAL